MSLAAPKLLRIFLIGPIQTEALCNAVLEIQQQFCYQPRRYSFVFTYFCIPTSDSFGAGLYAYTRPDI